ncbi:MAG: carboxypeptidase-like regulatory domain-containing protein [Bryobacteraceae bacterium]
MTKYVVLAVTLCAAVPAQQTPNPQPEQRQKTGTIEGRVVDAKTGAPLRRANVMLRPFLSGSANTAGVMAAASEAPYGATTGEDGKFRISLVDPGAYRLTADRRGYSAAAYGARGRSPMGTSLRVDAGARLQGIDVKLLPQAVIAGRVVDEEGEPMDRVQIQVLERRFIRGKAQWAPVGYGITLDTGDYRVAGLRPGRYWVSALLRTPASMSRPPRRTDGEPEESYVFTYYPGAAGMNEAHPVELAAGQEMAGADISMRKSRVYRIRGKVLGENVRFSRVMLTPRDNSQMPYGAISSFGGPIMKQDGVFEIGDVAPGSYYVAYSGPRNTGGRVPVEVVDGDVDNVVIALAKNGSMTGELRVESGYAGPKPDLSTIRVQLAPVEPVPFGYSGAQVAADGTFTIENVLPGSVRVSTGGLPDGFWVRAIRYGDADVLSEPLELTGEVAGSLEILIAPGTARIAGVVRNDKQEPLAGAMVTIVPDPNSAHRQDLRRTVNADQDGRFSLAGVAPGKYQLFAWEEVDSERLPDPEFLTRFESNAKKIELKREAQEQVTLDAISAEDAAVP